MAIINLHLDLDYNYKNLVLEIYKFFTILIVIQIILTSANVKKDFLLSAFSGEILNDDDLCTKCDGRGYKLKIKNLVIPLKNGLKTGNKIKMEGKGHNFKDHKTDLIIEIIGMSIIF